MNEPAAGDPRQEWFRRVLERLPQQRPFRFVDRILDLDEHGVVSEYRFRHDEPFYAGHFPGRPVTPGVILLETMAQGGLSLLAIHLALVEEAAAGQVLVPWFTDAEVDFRAPVFPGQTVRIEARRVLYRRRKLRVEASLHREDGQLACSGTLAGIAEVL